MEWLGLHNKPMAEVHPGHMLTGPKEEEEKAEVILGVASCGHIFSCSPYACCLSSS
jgi:hypothetical protein